MFSNTLIYWSYDIVEGGNEYQWQDTFISIITIGRRASSMAAEKKCNNTTEYFIIIIIYYKLIFAHKFSGYSIKQKKNMSSGEFSLAFRMVNFDVILFIHLNEWCW